MNRSSVNSLFDRTLAAVGASLSLFLFLPLVVYVTNLNDVEIAKQTIVTWGLVTALATAGIVFAVSCFERAESLVVVVARITLLALFALILFPNETGEITGFETGAQGASGLWALGKLAAGVALGVFLARRLPRHFKTLANVLALVVIGACVILYSCFTSAADEARNSYVSPNREFVELGHRSNIFVLMVDTFTGHRFGEILDQDPGLKSKFEGFTFYPNAIAPAVNTVAGNSVILTGDLQIAVDEPGWLKRNSESLARSFLNIAMEKGYKTAYISNLKVRGVPVPAIAEYGFIPARTSTWQSELKSFLSFLAVSFARVFPNEFAGFLGQSMSNLFARLGGNAETALDLLDRLPGPAEQGPLKSKLAFEAMINELHVGQAPYSAVYFHSKMAHPKWNFTEDGEYRPEAGWRSTSRYVARAVGTFLDKLKSIGSFDNSLVVIVSDHGGIPVSDSSLGGYFTRSEKLIHGFNPLVLIKPAQSSGALRTSPMTVWLGDIYPTVLDALGIDTAKDGNTGSRSLLGPDEPAREIAVPLFFKPEEETYHSVLGNWERVDVHGDFKVYGAIMKKSLAR